MPKYSLPIPPTTGCENPRLRGARPGTYQLHNLNRTRLENIFHRVFGAAQLDLAINDRFGNPVKPKERFLLPLQVIDEAVARIRDGSITDAVYDLQTARLVG